MTSWRAKGQGTTTAATHQDELVGVENGAAAAADGHDAGVVDVDAGAAALLGQAGVGAHELDALGRHLHLHRHQARLLGNVAGFQLRSSVLNLVKIFK